IRMRAPRPAWPVALLSSAVAALLLISSGALSHRPSVKKMSQATVVQAAGGPWGWCVEELLGFRLLSELFKAERADAWVFSLIGSLMVGLSGIFPLLVIPIEAGAALKTDAGCQRLKQLLSFAIGGLLGDVFLHLLPEAWAYSCNGTGTDGSASQERYKLLGLWVIVGLLSFLILEKMFPDRENQDDPEGEGERQSSALIKGDQENKTFLIEKAGCETEVRVLTGDLGRDRNQQGCSGSELHCGQMSCPRQKLLTQSNGNCSNSNHSALKQKMTLHQPADKIKTSGYLNLLANCIDNFTHGLAVAGSFLVSRKVGFLTTLAILLHEIPHEVGDFAILLRAGFDRWSAAKMQLSTAMGGVLGACFALCAQSPKGAENTISWILPFTSGGFLYIALVNVVPELLEETNPRLVVNLLYQCIFVHICCSSID
ncbi:S39AD protein, partial [Atractosteus spatula]|nr:S39AD protein [Atractosteus spatula]